MTITNQFFENCSSLTCKTYVDETSTLRRSTHENVKHKERGIPFQAFDYTLLREERPDIVF